MLATDPDPQSMMSWGGFVPSRLLYLVARLLLLVSAKLTGPSPETRNETSMLYHLPLVTGPDEPTTAPNRDALP